MAKEPIRIAVNSFREFSEFWWGDRGLSALLLLFFVSLFISPFVDSFLLRIISSLFFSLLLISGVVSISSRPLIRCAVALVALTAIVLRWADNFLESHTISVWSAAASLIFLALLTCVMLIRVFRNDGQVTSHRIQGALAVYLLFGFTWSTIYQIFDLSVAGAFNFPAASLATHSTQKEIFTYFSFITLTTLGYGDITAVHPTARMFVILEALVGQLYPATLLARLVSLAVTEQNECKDDIQ